MVKTETPMNRFILLLFFLQPIFFNPRGDDVFHLAKNTYFCAFLKLLFIVWLVRRVESEERFCFLKSEISGSGTVRTPLLQDAGKFYILVPCAYLYSPRFFWPGSVMRNRSFILDR